MKDKNKIPFTKRRSIVFRQNDQAISVYKEVSEYVSIVAEEYKDANVVSIMIRIYLDDIKEGPIVNLIDDDILMKIGNWKVSKKQISSKPTTVGGRSSRNYSKYLTPLKSKITESRGLIVADTETLLFNKQASDTLETNKKIHIPYAIGFLVVSPGDDLSSLTCNVIETYFSEEYPSYLFPTFEERSKKMMTDFVHRLSVLCRNKIKTVYFHNFSRFDGIFLLKHFLTLGSQYRIKPMIMNNLLYEISVYKGKNLIFRLRDSYTLLPSSLKSLSTNLCPSLGSKGSIDHKSVTVSNLSQNKDQLLEYMRQDIRLLGGIMLKAQDIYMSNYSVDIVSKLTVSSLALTIFHTCYYDVAKFPIYIPSMNEDNFIRLGYYGGHTDAYIPFGENLYYI